MMRCAIWYHLHNFKNVKNTHGGVLLLVTLHKSNTPPWVPSTFFKFYKWYQTVQNITLWNSNSKTEVGKISKYLGGFTRL